jgi:hypothetical protein
VCLIKHHTTKVCGGLEVRFHTHLTSALEGDELSASCHCKFIPGEKVLDVHWIRGWVDLIASRDFLEERSLLPLSGNISALADAVFSERG